jgi:hypothetical protein
MNLGIPQYIAIDRKPENGGEIQDASCGKSGIMLRLKVVKGAEADCENHDSEEETLHGAKVLYDLVSPWRNSHQIVCAQATLHLCLQLYFCGDMGYDLLG